MIWRLWRRLAAWRVRRARTHGLYGLDAWTALLATEDEPALRYPDGHELAGHSRRARRTRVEFLESHARLEIARPRPAADVHVLAEHRGHAGWWRIRSG